MKGRFIKDCETILDSKIIHTQTVGGGCIANNLILHTEKNNTYFLKSGNIKGMFPCEANGLKEIEKSTTIRVPHIIYVEEDFLLMEYIQPGKKREDFFITFGKKLANMHRYTNQNYGFYENNFIGSTIQVNVSGQKDNTNWAEFYYKNRLLFQFNLARKKGYITKSFEKTFDKFSPVILKILKEIQEPPALLHGDLWIGNYMCDNTGQPLLIDPAVYYGHRETDLAMTLLFGGFPPSFYEAYQQEYPLADGWEKRVNVYKLYHILNHLNMFGRSYINEAEALIRYYF